MPTLTLCRRDHALSHDQYAVTETRDGITLVKNSDEFTLLYLLVSLQPSSGHHLDQDMEDGLADFISATVPNICMCRRCREELRDGLANI